MSSGGGDLQSPLHRLLPHDIGKIRLLLPLSGLRLPDGGGGEGSLSPEMGHKLLHGLHRVYGQTLGQGGLGGVFRREVELAYTQPGSRHGHGQHTAYGPQPSGETQLPYEGRVGRKGRQLLRGSQDAQKNGQVVDRPLLALGGRGQIHGNAADGVPGPAVLHRRPNPLPGLLHRRVRQPYNIKGGQAAGEEALHAHLISAEAAQAQRAHGNDHVAHSFQRLDDNSHGSMRLALIRCRCPRSAYQIILILPQNHAAGNKNIKKVPIRCKNFCA